METQTDKRLSKRNSIKENKKHPYKKRRINPNNKWKTATIILGVIVLGLIYLNYY